MTAKDLIRSIARFQETPPITSAFERILVARGRWDNSRVWYGSQKQHWVGWLSEYNGPGYYGRKNSNRSAEFIYNHIVCPPMVLWLAEAAGVPKFTVAQARKAALSARSTLAAQCAAIRRTIHWEMIEDRLGHSRKRSSSRL